VNRLPDYLADLAEEVQTPVDMRDRVLVSSRRATVRRRLLLAGSAAATVVVIASGVAWAGLPGQRTGKGQVASSSSPSATAEAPRKAAPPKTAPTRTASSAPPQAGVPYRLLYLTADGGLKNADGTTVFTPETDACGLTASPGGALIAYVTADGGGPTGDLIVAGQDGSEPRIVLGDVACMGGTGPVWMPDGESLLVRQRNTGPRVVVRLDTGRTQKTPFRDVQGYLVRSPSGNFFAYQEDDTIVVARPDGTVVHRRPHGDETPTGGFSVQGVSDDGSRVVVGMNNTDPGFVRNGFRLVDMTTGRNLRLPVPVSPPGPERVAIHPLGGNRLLIRSDGRLHLVSGDGRVLGNSTEPAALRNATLLPPS
jgi:hypothetical protein